MTHRAIALLAWWYLIVWPDPTSTDPRPYIVGPGHATEQACERVVKALLASPAQWARHAACVRDPRGGR